MKIVYELTEEDIKDIIAEHFKLPVNSVIIETGVTTKGYGMNEYQAGYVKARIEKDANCN